MQPPPCLQALQPPQRELVDQRLGPLKSFRAANPSGRYSLTLAHVPQRLLACRLLGLYRQQHAAGLCSSASAQCFMTCSMDGREVEREDPHAIAVPKQGLMQVSCA